MFEPCYVGCDNCLKDFIDIIFQDDTGSVKSKFWFLKKKFHILNGYYNFKIKIKFKIWPSS